MRIGHVWTYDEDYTCCKLYLEFALDETPFKSIAELKYKVERALPQIKPSSLQMKLANIKYLVKSEPSARLLFPNGDGVPISSLNQYSEQCRQAFLRALKNVQNPVTEDPDPDVTPDKMPELHVGDSVMHKSFGAGTVIKIEHDVARVRFESEEKSLCISYSFGRGLMTKTAPETPASKQPETPASKQPETHAWTYEEEFALCRLYLDHRYGNLSALTPEELILLASVRLPDVSFEDAKTGLEFVDALMEREDAEIDEDDPDDDLLLKKVLGHALKDFVKTELKEKQH